MATRGQKPIPIPENFKQKYLDFKAKGFLDRRIAADFFVSIDTLQKWKNSEGLVRGQFFNNINTNRKGMKYNRGR